MTELARGDVWDRPGSVPVALSRLGAFVADLVELVEATPDDVNTAALLDRWHGLELALSDGIVKAHTPFGTMWLGLPPDAPAVARLTTAYYPEPEAADVPPLVMRQRINDEFERVRLAIRARLAGERRVGTYQGGLAVVSPFHWARWHGEASTTYLVQDDFDMGLSRDLSVWIVPVAGLTAEPPMLPIISELLPPT